jgi:hypothetical protein
MADGPDKLQALATEQIARYEDGYSKYRSVFENDHQYIANYFLPQDSDINTKKTEGVTGWTDQIYDTTPVQAANTYAAGDYNWLTPPQQPWAELGAPKEVRDEDGEIPADAQQWLGKASDDIMDAFARSNFPSARAQNALGIGVFGTDFILFDEDEDEPGEFNFKHVKIGTYVIEEDYKGVVDTTRTLREMTFRQIEQKFSKPKDNIPSKMRDAAKGANGRSKKFKVLHCIFPRKDSDRLPDRKDGENMPIASVFISVEFKEVLRVSGYHEQPSLVPRFAKWGTDNVWGYGPAYLALPDARELNYIAQYMDAAAEKLIDPRILVPSNLEGDVDLRAGGVTTYDENVPGAMPKEWASAAEYKLGMEIMEQKREAIRDAFFNKSFQLLNSQPLIDKKMTAYEISQRQAENLQGVTPMLGRRIPEFINPLMRRAFGIRFRAGKLGKPPESLLKRLTATTSALRMPQVVVTSRISDAMKALKNRGTEETVQFVLPIVQQAQKPELLDVFDFDKIVKDYAMNTGMPPDSFRPEKGENSVAALRAQRAKIMQQQRQAALAEQVAKGAKNLAQSPQWMQDGAEEAATGGKK